jgi:hypothetical protein
MTKKINTQTDKLFKAFSPSFLSLKTGIKMATVCCHSCRRKASPEAAIKYCDVPEVKKAGFKKEILRPDIPTWLWDFHADIDRVNKNER